MTSEGIEFSKVEAYILRYIRDRKKESEERKLSCLYDEDYDGMLTSDIDVEFEKINNRYMDINAKCFIAYDGRGVSGNLLNSADMLATLPDVMYNEDEKSGYLIYLIRKKGYYGLAIPKYLM